MSNFNIFLRLRSTTSSNIQEHFVPILSCVPGRSIRKWWITDVGVCHSIALISGEVRTTALFRTQTLRDGWMSNLGRRRMRSSHCRYKRHDVLYSSTLCLAVRCILYNDWIARGSVSNEIYDKFGLNKFSSIDSFRKYLTIRESFWLWYIKNI